MIERPFEFQVNCEIFSSFEKCGLFTVSYNSQYFLSGKKFTVISNEYPEFVIMERSRRQKTNAFSGNMATGKTRNKTNSHPLFIIAFASPYVWKIKQRWRSWCNNDESFSRWRGEQFRRRCNFHLAFSALETPRMAENSRNFPRRISLSRYAVSGSTIRRISGLTLMAGSYWNLDQRMPTTGDAVRLLVCLGGWKCYSTNLRG